MNNTTSITSKLQILYTGEPFKIDPTKIPSDACAREEWAVPVMKDNDWPTADEMFSLFDLAVQAGAIVIPDGLDAYLHTDTDSDGEGVYLLVRGSGLPGVDRHLTTGWQNVDDFAVDQRRSAGDTPNDPSDPAAPETIAAALSKFTRELNLALGLTFDHELDDFAAVATEPAVVIRPVAHRWGDRDAEAFRAELLAFEVYADGSLDIAVKHLPAVTETDQCQ